MGGGSPAVSASEDADSARGDSPLATLASFLIRNSQFLILLGWFLLVAAGWLSFMLRTSADQGRLFFPALVPLALGAAYGPVSYTHLRAHETVLDLVCRLLLEKKNKNKKKKNKDHIPLSNTHRDEPATPQHIREVTAP